MEIGPRTERGFESLFRQMVRQKRLVSLKLFNGLVTAVLIYFFIKMVTLPIATAIGSALIVAAALFPTYLWCSGKAYGMPIFPAYALLYVLTYASPLLNQDKRIMQYSPEAHLIFSLTVTFYLLVSTFVWFQYAKGVNKIPKKYKILSGQEGGQLIWLFLIVSIVFNVATLGGWIQFIRGGIYPIVRAGIQTIGVISLFVLAYRLGRRELRPYQKIFFYALFIIFLVTSSASLFLIGAFASLVLVILALIVSRGKVPWLLLITIFVPLLFLHFGKSEMREKYWRSDTAPLTLQPLEYAGWFREWSGYSILNMKNLYPDSSKNAASNVQSLSERSSLAHILLMVQDRTPSEIPYLKGESYKFVPQSLVPRIFFSSKAGPHEGLYLLNMHYGLQSREETYKTTIGWGLLNEAYANFGILGCLILGILIGSLYGYTTQSAIYTPILSLRAFVCMILMSYLFRGDSAASVYLAGLFQALIVAMFLGMAFMKTRSYKTSDTIVY